MTSQTKRLALYTAAPGAFTAYALYRAHNADAEIASLSKANVASPTALWNERRNMMIAAGVGALATLFAASRAL